MTPSDETPIHPRRLTRECRAFLRGGLADSGLAQSGLGDGSLADGSLGEPESADSRSSVAPGEHLRSCGFCAERQSAARQVASWLREPVATPAALLAPDASTKLLQRINDQIETGPLGMLLAQAMPAVAAEPATDLNLPEQLLASSLAARNLRPPTEPSAPQWAAVRDRLWRQLQPVPQYRIRSLTWATFGGVAAAAVFLTFLLLPGNPPEPVIVITDIATFPGGDGLPMAILRGR